MERYNKICDKLQIVEDKWTILSNFVAIMKMVRKILIIARIISYSYFEQK